MRALLKVQILNLNHTECSRSNKVGKTSSMIPYFPASNGTGVHHCDNALNRSLPSHDTKDSPSNTSQGNNRPTTNDLCHCLENHKGHYLRNSDRKECSCCSLSQDKQSVSGTFLCTYVNNSQ